MKNPDIIRLSAEELKEKIKSEQENLRKMKFAHQIAAAENPMRIRETKKLIARMYTQLTVQEKKK